MNKNKNVKKTTRKKRFNILLTEEEFQFFKEIARIENKSIADILRKAVEYLYKPKNQEKSLKHLDYIIKKEYINSQQILKYYSEFDVIL